jgi:hypothetical protein
VTLAPDQAAEARATRTAAHALALGPALAALLALGPAVSAATGTPSAAATATPGPGQTLRVPSQFVDIEAAIEASRPGDVILLAPGTYPGDVEVPEDRPGITIRGEDRNTVVFDGEDTRTNAIDVTADGVTLENMTAHNFTSNGFYWDGVEGYAGRYLTVWNVGLYGIYAIESRDGIFEHSYVSGAADAAFYVGECFPCNATIRNVTATLSALGYSGTNAGGNLVVEDSRWLLNGIGIMPNSFDVAMQPPPQREATFRRNEIVGSGTVVTPRTTPLGGYHGIGIAVVGGLRNEIEQNDIRGSTRYGIAIFTAVDRTRTWVPSGNQVSGNRISDSGIADLALAGGDGGDNCFDANELETTLPANLDGSCSNLSDGDPAVAAELVRSPFELLEEMPPAPAYHEMDAPHDQPNMPAAAPVESPGPSPSAVPAAPTSSETVLLGASVLIVALFAAAIVFVAFRGRVSRPRG